MMGAVFVQIFFLKVARSDVCGVQTQNLRISIRNYCGMKKNASGAMRASVYARNIW